MNCPYCGKPAKYGPNEEFYNGKRFVGHSGSYMCYYCKPCGAYVGVHQNTTKPLGTMANQELRDWRRKAHAVFDPLWQSRRMTRNEAYQFVSKELGKETHIGESDIETCKKIIDFLSTPLKEK